MPLPLINYVHAANCETANAQQASWHLSLYCRAYSCVPPMAFEKSTDKAALCLVETRADTPSASRTRHRKALVILLLLGGTLWYYGGSNIRYPVSSPESERAHTLMNHHQHVQGCGPEKTADGFDWQSLVPSKNLNWVSCEDKYECARLLVPLDYSDPEGPQAAIAMQKIPAKVPAGTAGHRGPILFNPGGPGESGVALIKASGEDFRNILGDEYDLVGFDPRGIGITTPAINLFLSSAESVTWRLQGGSVINSTADALARSYARSQNFGKLAAERIGDVAQHVSTATVATDMLTITRALGREKLLYWGFSYGTVLGITYAAMFPDHIERLIVDGVVDTDDYMGALWSNNLRDTEKTLQTFYDACAESSPDVCALYESTGDQIRTRVNSILEHLRTHPMPATSNDASYGIVDYSKVRRAIFFFLYSPFRSSPWGAPQLATALAAIEKGDAQPMWELIKVFEPKLDCDCSAVQQPSAALDAETTLAIACGDGPVVVDSLEDLEKFYAKMAEDSSFAEIWQGRLYCSGWKIKANQQYRGPFVGNTSFPILLIGNTADPVTPLWNANKVAKGFKDAVVLTQDSPGHCSLSSTSLCTIKAIRAYFREGILPEAGTVCAIEDKMFGNKTTMLDSLTADDVELLQATRTLISEFEVPKMHF